MIGDDRTVDLLVAVGMLIGLPLLFAAAWASLTWRDRRRARRPVRSVGFDFGPDGGRYVVADRHPDGMIEIVETGEVE